MTMTTFNCELCGAQKTERTCWFKKRNHHFCSRLCANKTNAQKKAKGLTRKEYEKQYWAIPENKARRVLLAKENAIKRADAMGDSYKKMILSRCKARAKIRNIEFTITIDDIVIPKYCPILGLELKPNRGSGGRLNSPSLDRIDCSKGYIKGNIQVISNRANTIKSDATYADILKFAEWIKNSCHFENPVM